MVLERTTLKPKLNLRFKSHLSPVIDVSVKKDCLLVYILKFFEFLAAGGVVLWYKRDIRIRKVWVQPWIAIFFFFF